MPEPCILAADAEFDDGSTRARREPGDEAGFVGRAPEIARVRALLADPTARLVTLTGPGGVGKTRLALEIAGAVPAASDGEAAVAWVPLAAVTDTRHVLPVVARALGLNDAEERLPDALRAHLRDHRLLLILDNVEHLLPVMDLAGLLGDCPGLTILATSRHPVRIAGERIVEIAPLDPASAVQLFRLRAERTPGAAPIRQADAPVVEAICARVDRLPLAIELAVAWTRVVRPSEILDQLENRLGLLRNRGGARDVRHVSLRDAIAWSYDLLTADEQAAFRRLCVFPNGLTRAMADAMLRGRAEGAGYPFADGYGFAFPFLKDLGYDPTAAPHNALPPASAPPLPPVRLAALDALASLMDHSLLIRRDVDGEENARYGFLDTIREFGLEQLAASGEDPAVMHAFAATMLAISEASAESLFHANRRIWGRDRVDAEYPNIIAALARSTARGDASAELALRIAGSLWAFWQSTGRAGEGREWLERALALRGAPAWSRATSLPSLAFLCWIQGADERAAAVLDEAEPVGHATGIMAVIGSNAFYRALLAWRGGPSKLFEMLDHLERALAAFQRGEDPVGIGVCKLAFGQIARVTGDPEGALTLFEEAHEQFVLGGYEWGLASALYYAGQALWDQATAKPELAPRAVARLAEGLRAYWALGDGWGAGGAISALACCAAARGEDALAARLFGAAQSLLGRIGAFLPPSDLDSYDAVKLALRARMGTARYDAAFAAGLALTPEDGVSEALAFGRALLNPAPDVGLLAALTGHERALLRAVIAAHRAGEQFSAKNTQEHKLPE